MAPFDSEIRMMFQIVGFTSASFCTLLGMSLAEALFGRTAWFFFMCRVVSWIIGLMVVASTLLSTMINSATEVIF